MKRRHNYIFEDQEIRDIRKKVRSGHKQKDCARKYGVSEGTISRIVNYKSYTEIQDN